MDEAGAGSEGGWLGRWARRVPRADLLHLAALLAVAAALAHVVTTQGLLETLPPVGDDSSHLTRALRMRADYWGAPTLTQRILALLFPWDSYPGALYAVTVFTFDSRVSERDLLEALNAFFVAHLLLGWALARHLWGRPAAWAYTAIVGLSPLLLFAGHRYNADIPLAHLVGLGLLSLVASRGFTVPWASILFGALAGVGLLTKWAWFYFLALPSAAVAAWALWRSFRGMRARVVAFAAASALSAAIAWGMWTFGPTLGRPFFGIGAHAVGAPYRLLLAAYVGGIVFAAASSALALRLARGRPSAPAAHLAAAVLWILAIAGPWYLLLQASLRDRLRHESGVHESRSLGFDKILSMNAHTVEAMYPALAALVILGLAIALLKARREVGPWLLAVGGAAVAVVAITETIPPNPRYLFPVAPMLGVAAVCGLRGLGRWAWLPAAGTIALGLVAVAGVDLHRAVGWPPFIRDPELETATGGATVPMGGLGFTFAALADAPREDFSALGDLVADLDAACPPGPCPVGVFALDDYPVQGRAIEGVAALYGMERGSYQLVDGGPGVPGNKRFDAPPPDLVIFQPCGRHHGPGESNADRVERFKARLTELGVTSLIPLGTYALPERCEMSLWRMER